jgi:hypothetical protein
MTFRRRLSLACSGLVVFAAAMLTHAQQGTEGQIADPDFKPAVTKPAYVSDHPLIVLDEAHANFHTAAGRYKPFVELLQADGYRVVPGTEPFTSRGLADARVLVIANAVGRQFTPVDPPSAFTDAECDAVRDWVQAGGSLLLIADHTPFGATAAALAERFGVEMGKGYAWTPDPATHEPSTKITYTPDSGLSRNHPITRGVQTVVAFTGQSLSVPPRATALLQFGNPAFESLPASAEADQAAFRDGKPVAARKISNRAQAVALDSGKGRVVMTGEAAMFSAQLIRFTEQGKPVEFKMGMNVPGNDNQTFLLNILHWLTRR